VLYAAEKVVAIKEALIPLAWRMVKLELWAASSISTRLAEPKKRVLYPFWVAR
jgi:hypothetical protein